MACRPFPGSVGARGRRTSTTIARVTSANPSYSALRFLLDEVVMIHDEARQIVFVSPSVEGILGYTEEEFLRLTTPELIHPEDLAVAAAQGRELRAERGATYRSVFRARRKDGSWLWVEAIGRNLLHEPEVRGVISTLRDISKQRRLEKELEHQATHDDLTGLADRRKLLRVLDHEMPFHQQEPLALLYIDLDGLKEVNDTFGHQAGDQLLRSFAARLKRACRSGDLAARFGGDEFVVLCRQVGGAEGALRTAERVVSQVRGTTTVDGKEIEIRLSAGVALAPPAAGAEELIREADRALYEAKRAGGDRVVAAFDRPGGRG